MRKGEVYTEMRRIERTEAADALGIVIVIDVIRAFSVAAYALAGGAQRLWLVRSIEEAFALRALEPNALLAGEIGKQSIPGFDFNNSPALIARTNVRQKLIIQRTSAGTQGAVDAVNAEQLLACALVNAQATVTFVHELLKTGK